MTIVGLRELRTNASDVIRRVEAGERVTVTVDRRPVAEIIPLRRRTWLPRTEAIALLRQVQPDPAMEDLLAELREERVGDNE
ncbi:type II toxin-antitoxin system prevent-host-death family antitoxin [Frankia sp. Cas4]|uniref:type II toxin-antitoxin system Phd/YefM family antitoxin n=1 Tax=Frankia sp. Cas4 TaxID=3073927 RepID=UPI002AD41ABD|nr:type II toxin-antitoxin system prevent-host-death family antitoxin [Frankia sp. Cas4]